MISPRHVSADDLRRAWLTESELSEIERLGDYDLSQYEDEE